MRPLASFLLATCLLGGALARADPVPEDVQARFLRDRDVKRLLEALEAPGAHPPETARCLARLAAGLPIPAAPALPGPEGAEGLAQVVAALREGRLDEAGERAARVDHGSSLAGGWVHALVRLRRGDDAGAIGRILAPPFMEWRRDAFDLALLGAALLPEDRRMLAAGVRAALERAAARRRTPAIVATARALAALDPEEGRRAHAFAVDALRRDGETALAVSLLAAAPSAGVAPSDPLLALQAALLAWDQGDPGRMATILAGRPAPGTQGVYLALRRARRRVRPVFQGPPLGHSVGAQLHAVLGARLATALGVPTSAAEMERWCREHTRDPLHAATLRAFLEARGFVVLAVAGDSSAGDALLAQGLPFVISRLEHLDGDYVDTPAIVKGYDSATGLWVLDEPDVRLFDVVPHAIAVKARFLCAVPADRRTLLAPFEDTAAARAGRSLEAALDAAQRAGRGVGPAATLPVASSTVADLYRAYLVRRTALEGQDAGAWGAVREAVERTRRVAPMLAFEERARGEALAAAGLHDEALSAFDRVAYLEGDDAELALARFSIERSRGQVAAARTALEAALRLAPLDVRALYHRAALHIESGTPDEARADLWRGLQRHPEAVRFAVALSGLELRAGRPLRALDLLADLERRNRAMVGDPVLRLARREAEALLIERAENVAQLRSLARSEDATTRRRLAFEIARRSGEADAAEPLLRTLLADADTDVRVTTLRLYMRPWLRARIEADAVLTRRVAGMLEKDEQPIVRRAAVDLLGRIPSALACRAVGAALAGDTSDVDAGVRGAAARALGGHALEACRDVLVAALADPDTAVRKAAIQTLFELTGTTRGFEAADPPEKRAAGLAAWRTWLTAR